MYLKNIHAPYKKEKSYFSKSFENAFLTRKIISKLLSVLKSYNYLCQFLKFLKM